MDQPVILCGLGQVGRRVLDFLNAAGIPVIVIDNRCKADELKLENVRLIHGDFRQREVLVEARVAEARGVLILTSDDLANISATLLVRNIDANVRVVVRLFNQNLIPRLGKTVNNVFALSVSQLTAPMLALAALTGQASGTFHVDEGRLLVAEVTVAPESPVRGQSIATVARRHGAQVVAHVSTEGTERFIDEVDESAPLSPGDRLVVCGEPRHLEPLLEATTGESSPHLRWAGWLRRHWRVFWQTITEIDPLVKLWTVVLIFVVAASALVYYFAINKTLAYSLMRAVSIVATGDDLHPEDLKEEWHMVFVSILRLGGAVVMAAFTAFLTNYLLRARLRGTLEIRRIPDSGHVIVCGLGNLGFRVVEELVRSGHRVVVIEPVRDGRFTEATQRLNAAIIVADATVLQVLRQANAATARAVVAATNNELANIEIALLARDLNPRQRVVVRLNDPQLAEMLRESANIGYALSLPTLAAPAFTAALFGDKVLSVFLVRRRPMAAVEFLVSPDDSPFIDNTVRALSIDYRILPISVRTTEGLSAQLMNHRFAVGDRFTCLMALTDLGRMLRREAPKSDWHVDLIRFTLFARPLVIQLLRERLRLQSSAAEEALAHLPMRIASDLTRGKAEDLKAALAMDGIEIAVRKDGTNESLS